jgi:hypothetical protein
VSIWIDEIEGIAAVNISISRDGVEIGDWTEEEVRTFFNEGRLVGTDYYWREGMSEWCVLTTLIKPPPPFPPPPFPEQSLSLPQVSRPLQPIPIAIPETVPITQHQGTLPPLRIQSEADVTPDLVAAPSVAQRSAKSVAYADASKTTSGSFPVWLQAIALLICLIIGSLLVVMVNDMKQRVIETNIAFSAAITAKVFINGILLGLVVSRFRKHPIKAFLIGLVILSAVEVFA